MLFGKFRILGKLALLVLVPLLGVVALSVPIVINRIDAARDAQKIKDLVELGNAVGSTVQDLQEERLLSVGYIFQVVQGPELVAQSAKVQEKLAALTRRDKPLNGPMRRAVAGAARLSETRAAVLSGRLKDPNAVVNAFTAAVQPLIDGLGLRTEADLTTSVGRQLYALDYGLRTNDLINQSSGYLTAAALSPQPAAFIGLFYSILVQLQNDIIAAQVFFTPSQYKLYLSAQDAWSSRVGAEFLQKAAIDPASAVQLLNRESLFPSLRSVNVLGGFVEKRVSADVNAAVTDNRDSALQTALWVGGASLLLLLMVFGLSIVMARAVARPLQRLTRSADRIARAAEGELERVADDEAEVARPIRLDPVDVAARDEIGDLARAFDRVQTTAVRLVERQVVGRRNVAQMFGHVGRRTQNLVGRQLALIDNLERRETDSDRLRELYRLDHMSSRLRRNASSLVVLSGGAGTNEHMAPLALSDVVRLALGEIEDYTRVDVEVPEEIVIVPAVVADLTLLLAELMENATSFSPPHTQVAVTAAELRGGARLAIVDHGLGLSPERLAEENARLTRRERLDLAPTEVLGLFVVGRLARRHGIEVTLTDTPEGGVTAWVDLRPAHLVAPAETLPPGVPIQAIVTSPTSEYGSLLAGRRSAPGSIQPFDANMLDRATRTLQSAQSWNAFDSHPALPAAASAPVEAEIVEDEPARRGQIRQDPARPYDAGTPVAGRHPTAMPELPAGPIEMKPVTPPFQPVVIPRPRTAPEEAGRNGHGNGSGLRRRVPGTQLPTDVGPKAPIAPPTTDDAVAAREAFEAFEAGVTRAQWDVIEADVTGTPVPGQVRDSHPPLARRTPGASLPDVQPQSTTPPPASPTRPLDPDAARALVEQFEYGVALALNESKNQHEGQSR
ncbi:ATP-binding protein [Actinoplanes sp. NPDC049265]|uniref:sensor histidine kinase n=1 Tax=Actinoplanes sp. NPDC049265 TaxID=3363902 RepID=UPI003718085B